MSANPTNIGQVWRAVRDRFVTAQIDSPARDARLLAEKAFGFDAAKLISMELSEPSVGGLSTLDVLAERRLEGEPIARLLGEKEFFGLTFGLNAATLVPRPETELLVELGVQKFQKFQKFKDSPHVRIADLGTGTGCVGLSLLTQIEHASAIAIDLSAEALDQAQQNAQRLGVANRVEFREGSWFAPIEANERFDLIVSNPPYIERTAITGLDREVRLHDPILALDGGEDGLEPYRDIAVGAINHLTADGAIIVEIGQGQAKDVAGFFRSAGFSRISSHRDLSGIERAILSQI